MDNDCFSFFIILLKKTEIILRLTLLIVAERERVLSKDLKTPKDKKPQGDSLISFTKGILRKNIKKKKMSGF
ncbi:MAG: hypothetical protein HamCj_14870 [Candidatus Hamiltonella defensa (Ceratovacuna japonica)]